MPLSPNGLPPVQFAPPAIGDEEIREVTEALRSGWLTSGPKARQFEDEFAEMVGAPAALCLNSCTAGLHLALLSMGIGPGDEVITTPLTFAATVNVIEHVGATAVLVDVEPDTLNIDPCAIERNVSSRTRAIIPVHYAGHPAEMDSIQIIAESHNLSIIEDAAHSLPASFRGSMVGSSTNLTAFSFYATKNMTTAEGGMLTGERELLEHARELSLHGLSRNAWNRYGVGGKWRYDVGVPGYKYNMSDLQAALGLCQLRRLASFQSRRRKIVRKYTEAFSSHPGLQCPVVRPHVESAWHLYVLRIHPERIGVDRDTFIQELDARGICASVHFVPIHTHSYYRDKYHHKPDDFPIAWENYLRMVSLPLSAALTDSDVDRVIEAVLDVASKIRGMAA